MKNLLFITHETTRTGAPFVLLHLLRWLRIHKKDLKLTVLSLRRGELHNDFKATVDSIYELSDIEEKRSFIQKLNTRFFQKPYTSKKDELVKKITADQFDLIYSNTVLSIPLGNKIESMQKHAKHIAHVHELNAIIKMFNPNFKQDIIGINHFIAASDLVKNNLIENWGISEDKVSRVYECSNSEIATKNESITSNVFNVGGSGTVHWRKGSDLFILVANYIKEKYADLPIKFTWVGHLPSHERIIIDEDLRKMSLTDKVSFVGQQKQPQDYYNAFDVFLMTSREDPFPLVCIEVGMLGKPIICFNGATGSEEIIKNGGGRIVPYLNVEAMAEQIVTYFHNKSIMDEDGAIIKELFSRFTPEDICPKYYEVILKVMKNVED